MPNSILHLALRAEPVGAPDVDEDCEQCNAPADWEDCHQRCEGCLELHDRNDENDTKRAERSERDDEHLHRSACARDASGERIIACEYEIQRDIYLDGVDAERYYIRTIAEEIRNRLAENDDSDARNERERADEARRRPHALACAVIFLCTDVLSHER